MLGSVRTLRVALILTGCVGGSSVAPDRPDEREGPSALVVPRFSRQPMLDEHLDVEEWQEARAFSGEFEIRDRSAAEGTYPVMLRIGATEDALHLGITIDPLSPNPWDDYPRISGSDCVLVVMSHDASVLTAPAFGLAACGGRQRVLDDDAELLERRGMDGPA